jgi:CubicO group peptidase (beta-lactamase class C family)
MRLIILFQLSLFFSLFGTVVYGQESMLNSNNSLQEPALRIMEPIAAIIADLESYIPGYIRQENIPGVAIAMIHDGKVVWTNGFGVMNIITGKPMTSESVFEVASNSKVVSAYIALRLVNQGMLSLDKPLNEYLTKPWLPSSQYRSVITLRHVLSHSSGLGHNTLSRDILFTPGSRYSYSGIGILYLQAVIEQVTGKSIEHIAQEMVFKPLGMSSSSFVNHESFTQRTANGHVHAILPTIIFLLAYMIAIIVFGFIGLVVFRILTGHWRLKAKAVIVGLALAFILSIIPLFIFLGKMSLLEFAWLIALCGFVFIAVYVLIFITGRFIVVKFFQNRSKLRVALIILWGILLLAGLIFCTSKIKNVPVPRWPSVNPMAAATLRASVGDMAKFLIELSHPQQLSDTLATELKTPQIQLSDDLSWGLGPGIQHSQQGDALWQWGQHLDFQSIMIIYPEHGFGAVVCTNSDLLNPDVAIEIAHRALGGKINSIRRASHLEFNYRGER